jgi:hypothetical protein
VNSVNRIGAAAVALLVVAVMCSGGPTPVGHAITYQGLLRHNGQPLNASADLQFRLFAQSSGGSPITPMLQLLDEQIEDGLISADLDFGAGVFGGEARWLEVSVRSPAGNGTFTTLLPRQLVTATPYALFALAGNEGPQGPPGPPGPPGDSQWELDKTDTYFLTGNVGLGTATPATRLHVDGSATIDNGSLILGNGTLTAPVVTFNDDPDTGIYHPAPNVMAFVTGGVERMRVGAAGNIGIGTVSSGPRLEVADNTAADSLRVVRVLASSTGTNQQVAAIVGQTDSSATFNPGAAVWGVATATTGASSGIRGEAAGATGRGVFGFASHTTGANVGIYGASNSANGYAGFFEGRAFFNNVVGLGVLGPAFQLQLSQNSAAKPTSNAWTIASDRRLKKNIQPIQGALNRLMRLEGVTYQWIDPATQGDMAGTYTGLIAQNVEEVFPEWISTMPDGHKALTVIGFEGLAIEALRELRAEKDSQIDSLKGRVGELEAQVAELRAMVQRLAEKGG